MRFALLSNVTVDLLAQMLKNTGEVYLASGFDTWQQEILAPVSGLYRFMPEAVVILLHADAYADTWNDADKGRAVVDEWCAAFQVLCNRLPGVPVYVSSIDLAGVRCRYAAEARLDQYFENTMTQRIEELHDSGSSIYILPVKDAVTDIGREQFYSAKMWYVGAMPYSMAGLKVLAELIGRYAGLEKREKKKCIAVDLDNTLWGGIIGEDGVDGILLSNNKEGARYKDAQRMLKKMKDQGVLLAILSKNNAADVEPAFSHPDMVLQHKDFVAEMVNWQPKTQNIRQLAKALNIGLDAFVFLDDNPAERAQMRSECPEVTVVDFPKDSAQLPDVIAQIYDTCFLSLEVTGEDGQKTAMYKAESQRRAEQSTAPSMESYLQNLQMVLDIHAMKAEEEKRVTQLINKTNQFNVTTKRYTEAQVHGIAQADDCEIITASMADKFGSAGLIAVLILKYLEQEARIDTFLMSCRVMGREIEAEIMACVKQKLLAQGIKTVRASYVQTAKNVPVEKLFDTLGFRLLAAENGEREYIANTADLPQKRNTYKEVKIDL